MIAPIILLFLAFIVPTVMVLAVTKVVSLPRNTWCNPRIAIAVIVSSMITLCYIGYSLDNGDSWSDAGVWSSIIIGYAQLCGNIIGAHLVYMRLRRSWWLEIFGVIMSGIVVPLITIGPVMLLFGT
jgi:hypothetical protein